MKKIVVETFHNVKPLQDIRFGRCRRDKVFFSRSIGKDEQGNTQYERLCTFKSIERVEVEPIPEKVTKLINLRTL